MNKVHQKYLVFAVGVLSIFFTACEQNRLNVDVSDIPVQVEVQRFDKDLFALDTATLLSKSAALQSKYPAFYPLYFNNILGFTDTALISRAELTKQIITNASFKDLRKDCDSVFPSLTDINRDLTDAFKHYKYYFPNKAVPKVLSFIDEFAFNVVNGDSLLGIGLHMFLGQHYKYYPSFQYPEYLTRRFTPEHVVPVTIKGFLQGEFSQQDSDKTLLSKMITEGKLLYALDALMPDCPDSLKIGYSSAQLDWCKTFESDIWATFINEKLLYNENPFDYNRYLEEAPFTMGLDNESAPRLGQWVGWQIVRKYMNEHPDVTLAQLMTEKDYKKILKESKYKPKVLSN